MGVRFGIIVPFEELVKSRVSESVSQTMTYLKGLEDTFESAWVPDHLVPFTPAFMGGIFECLTTISYLSGVFKKYRFGSLVLGNSFRNPALVAKIGATLDSLTGGRFILGIGAGWNKREYMQYGYSFPPPAVRIKQMEEAVQIIKAMWSRENVTFKGKYFSVKNAHCSPKPDPPPPIMIGGGGERQTLDAVARYADWWNLDWVDLPLYKHKLIVLKEHCARVGRNPDDIVKTLLGAVVIADTDEKALKIAEENRFQGSRYTFASIARFIGTIETVKSQIKAFIEVGVEYFILAFLPVSNINIPFLFGEEVIPEFK